MIFNKQNSEQNPTHTNLHTKHKPHPKPKQTQFNPSNTGVYPVRSHGLGCWGNPRVVFSVRIDKRLKKDATRVLKAVYGSTCNGIETFLAGLVATYEQQGISGVYPRNTSIGQIVIERNLRERRKVETVTYEASEKVSVKCHFCSSDSVGEFRYLKTGDVYPLCGPHGKALVDSGIWGIVSDGYVKQ